MNEVSFMYGTKQNYDALTTKDVNTLYFLTDTLQLFKGSEEYTKTAKLVSSLPETGQVQGCIYVKLPDFSMYIYNGVEFVQINKTYTTSIPASPTDDDVPTTKAVATYVTNKIADVVGGVGTFVTDVSYVPATGILSVAKGTDPVNTVLTGVVNNPTYDATTRTIQLPVFGGDTLTIALGKDAFVESGSYDSEKETIELVLTSGDKVSIPVGSLIDIYTGIATSTATVTVSADNKISVNVKVSAVANNAIVIEEDGLYVSVPDAYTKAEVDAKVKAVSDALSDHEADSVVHITSAERATWNAKVSAEQLNAAKAEAIATAATDATEKADQALATAKAYADDLSDAMNDRVSAVESSIQWKTIG